MTDSSNAMNPSCSLDAELIALWHQMEPFVEEWNKSVEIAGDIERDVKEAIARLPEHLCVEERLEAAIKQQDEAYRKAGVRHTDNIIEMEVPSLKIMALPGDNDWDNLCVRKLIDSVLDFADRS